jgi:alpha-beta hydrolase superfamily lysophospholipase
MNALTPVYLNAMVLCISAVRFTHAVGAPLALVYARRHRSIPAPLPLAAWHAKMGRIHQADARLALTWGNVTRFGASFIEWEGQTMAGQVTYQSDHAGDWGVATAVDGGRYKTGTMRMRDGVDVYYRAWLHPDAQRPILLLMHGLGAHTGWFIDMGNSLNEQGLTVYAMDHRGFGRSGGMRGHAAQAMMPVRDAQAVLEEIRKRHPGTPVSILGHSLGALFALHMAADDSAAAQHRVAGMILVNPGIAVTWKVPFGRQLAMAVGGLRGSTRQWSLAPGHELMTTNDEAKRMLDADNYWQRTQSAAFIYQVALRLRTSAMRRAQSIRTPALVIQCEGDLSVVPAASRRCYDMLGSSDKTWKTYPNFSHDFEFEPNRGPLDADIVSWVLGHR